MKFAAIAADPPWAYKVWSKDTGQGRSAEAHYRTMDIDAIKRVPVAHIAAPDCALFMWVTMPTLPQGLEVLATWGFQYKTVAFTWVKGNRKAVDTLFWGLGHWTRANAELCLLATRGKPKRLARDVHSVIQAPVGAHSAKPDEYRARIERLVAGPYAELFCREPRPGWASFGNAVDGLDINEALYRS